MPHRISRAERLANFFRRSPGRWFDGRELATVAGCYGWRSRVSDVRRAPFLMTIENRQRAVRQADGTQFTISEYRYVPPPAATVAAAPTWELVP
jgi:hypothetical protein